MNSVAAMLFDLDGTLIDSAPDLVGALNWVRASEGLPELDIDAMSQYCSRGAVGLIGAGMPSADPEKIEYWKSLFLEQYAKQSYTHSSLFEGIEELLRYLETSKLPWGIVTNKATYLTVPILKTAGLMDRIACLVCGDTLSRNKPDPAPVVLACDMVRLPVETVLFVGDDLRDLQAGKAAGTMTAAVHYGYGIFEPADELVSRSIQIQHPSDLIQVVEKSYGR